jgi:hypothetical protein
MPHLGCGAQHRFTSNQQDQGVFLYFTLLSAFSLIKWLSPPVADVQAVRQHIKTAYRRHLPNLRIVLSRLTPAQFDNQHGHANFQLCIAIITDHRRQTTNH